MKILTLFKVLIVGYIDLLYSDACLYPKAFGLEKKKAMHFKGAGHFLPIFLYSMGYCHELYTRHEGHPTYKT